MAQFGIGLFGIGLVTAIAVVRLLWIAAALRKHAAQNPSGDLNAVPPANDQTPSP